MKSKILRKIYFLFNLFKMKMTTKNIVVTRRKGLLWSLNLNEIIDRDIFLQGYFEPQTIFILKQFLKTNMVVFDIGANIGAHTLPIAKVVGEQGLVVAFEPMEYARNKLIKNIELNNLKNVIFESVGLGDEKEKGNFNFRSSWTVAGGESLSSQNNNNIEIMTLDDYCNVHRIEHVDLIKIDVDGMDYRVLVGGKNTIVKSKPIIVFEFCEYTLQKYGNSTRGIYNLLNSIGYEIFDEKNTLKYDSYEKIIAENVDLSKNSINLIAVFKDTFKNQ